MSAKKILIVEDEKPLSNALALKLGKSGYEVEQAFDGQEALDALTKGRIGLVLLDLIIPTMDGFSVLGKIKAQYNKLPVIVLSNLSQNEDIDRVKKLGALDFLVKSDTPLVKVVEYVNKVFKKQ